MDFIHLTRDNYFVDPYFTYDDLLLEIDDLHKLNELAAKISNVLKKDHKKYRWVKKIKSTNGIIFIKTNSAELNNIDFKYLENENNYSKVTKIRTINIKKLAGKCNILENRYVKCDEKNTISVYSGYQDELDKGSFSINEDKIRYYLPYIIEYNLDDYYFINRDYSYIELNCKSLEKNSDFKRIYLFNDGNKPWDKKSNYYKYLDNLNQVLINKKLTNCLNKCDKTEFLLNINPKKQKITFKNK